MCTDHDTSWKDMRALAEEFADILSRRGFVATIHNTFGHQDKDNPCIEIGCGRWRLVGVTEYVYLAPADDGEWWFWQVADDPLAPVTRIAPAREVSVAADKVARSIAEIPRVGVRVI